MDPADQQHLAWIGRSFGRADSGRVELSQASIATLLATTRQSVNEALGTLRDLGAVETGCRRVEVVDRVGLSGPQCLAEHRLGR